MPATEALCNKGHKSQALLPAVLCCMSIGQGISRLSLVDKFSQKLEGPRVDSNKQDRQPGKYTQSTTPELQRSGTQTPAYFRRVTHLLRRQYAGRTPQAPTAYFLMPPAAI